MVRADATNSTTNLASENDQLDEFGHLGPNFGRVGRFVAPSWRVATCLVLVTFWVGGPDSL
jgi:hypothetical protein